MLHLSKRILSKARRSSRDLMYQLHGHLGESVTVRTRQGRLTMPTRDVGIGAPLYRERQYEFYSSLHCIRFLKSQGYVSGSSICMVDVGANIGLISTGLLLAGEVATSIAIEPEPRNFELLRRNVRQNQLDEKMCCVQFAVSENTCSIELELSNDNPGDHRVRQQPAASASERHNESAREVIEVAGMPLADILNAPEVTTSGFADPALVWIDVQGYEGFVFRGASNWIGTMPTVSEVWPYGILRSGMDLPEYIGIVSETWADYWIWRRGRFVRYPTSVFDRFVDEVGTTGRHENIILTNP